MKDLGTVLLSGLVGALLAAFLSYKVRLTAKRKEDEDARKRIAQVNFLMLTDTVASNFFIKNFVERVLDISEVKVEKGYDLAHAISALIASKSQGLTKDDLERVRILTKPVISTLIASLDRLEISAADLGHMAEVTIYAYHRYRISAIRLQASLGMLDALLDEGNMKLADAKVLHGFYQTYRDHAKVAGILRAAFGKSAGISSDTSLKSLVRSFEATKAEVVASLSSSSKLELAQRALEATNSDALGASESSKDA